jgi:shikimate kinase
VISTGGSAVYSEPAMSHLKADGLVVFLDIPLETVVARIGDYSARGISRRPDQSLEQLFWERFELYSWAADVAVNCTGKSQEDICDDISMMIMQSPTTR